MVIQHKLAYKIRQNTQLFRIMTSSYLLVSSWRYCYCILLFQMSRNFWWHCILINQSINQTIVYAILLIGPVNIARLLVLLATCTILCLIYTVYHTTWHSSIMLSYRRDLHYTFNSQNDSSIFPSFGGQCKYICAKLSFILN